MTQILLAADFIGFTRSVTPDSTSTRLFIGISLLFVIAAACTIYGLHFWAMAMKHRPYGDKPSRPGAFAIVSAFVLIFSILWGINVTALSNAKKDAEDAAKEAKEERHITAFAYHAIGETISAESHIYAATGSYTDAFPDLVGAEPGLNRFLVDDLVPEKRLELGSGAKSVMIEYTFYGPTARSGGQTLNVYLDEGAVTVAGCHAAPWIGCKDGHWRPERQIVPARARTDVSGHYWLYREGVEASDILRSTVDAEQESYRDAGHYLDGFPALSAQDRDLGIRLMEDLVVRKQLRVDRKGSSVVISFIFGGGQAFNVRLHEGLIVEANCNAAPWMGCKDGHWDPAAQAAGR